MLLATFLAPTSSTGGLNSKTNYQLNTATAPLNIPFSAPQRLPNQRISNKTSGINSSTTPMSANCRIAPASKKAANHHMNATAGQQQQQITQSVQHQSPPQTIHFGHLGSMNSLQLATTLKNSSPMNPGSSTIPRLMQITPSPTIFGSTLNKNNSNERIMNDSNLATSMIDVGRQQFQGELVF